MEIDYETSELMVVEDDAFHEFFEKCKAIIYGNAVLIPRELEVLIDAQDTTRQRDIIALVYAFVHQHQQSRKAREGSLNTSARVRIHSKRFETALGASSKTINRAKKALRENGFLEYPDDNYSNGRIVKAFSKPYMVKRASDLILYRDFNSTEILERSTADDWASQRTRENLNVLEFDLEMFRASLLLAVENRIRKHISQYGSRGDLQKHYDALLPTIYPVSKIVNHRGRVRRDDTGRLQSPFCQLKKEYRACFTYEGQHLSGIDLRAAHPTLVAHAAGDEKLKRDCVTNEFYGKISRELGCTRREAKRAYCQFAYGRIRKRETKRNAPAFAIQRLLEKDYVPSAEFITTAKRPKYKAFSTKMMGIESKIFIDGVFKELCDKGIFSSTVHDGIYFPSGNPEIEAVIEDSIARQMKAQFPNQAIQIHSSTEKTITNQHKYLTHQHT